ncbi:uncharacterized mitochondrial protein AtMg00810-like [Salvia miltiorrhiza]|uniref:uncharacterized mitochondrial protein AtMg00810-like n=1 Tax=Salvia miltiorrhiza TaxID=226208 RepID=UPI0025AD84D7|nr:uncharacterized mitochondrial protein AtMg00810-like [Salvia miltiorrhiza]
MRKNGKLILFLVYVDDILITGEDSTLITQIIHTLSQKFALKTLGTVNFFLGIHVFKTSSHSYLLNQSKYINDLLTKTNLADCKPQPSPYDISSKLSLNDSPPFPNPTLYRSTVGALQYLTLTRPDIAFMVNKLSQYLQTPTENQWKACKRLLRYLKGTLHYSLTFSPSSYLHLKVFSDADWAGSIEDRKSTGGFFVFHGSNLLSWSSKKQNVVFRSSTESEYRSLANSSAEVTWIQSLLHELGFPIPHTPIIWCDNKSAAAIASNPVLHVRTKHIEIDTHFVRDNVLKKELDVRYVPTEEQIADIFTKPLSISRFQYLITKFPLEHG